MNFAIPNHTEITPCITVPALSTHRLPSAPSLSICHRDVMGETYLLTFQMTKGGPKEHPPAIVSYRRILMPQESSTCFDPL
jgi:hypothetical protein